MAIRFRGVVTGFDRAAATFLDGWLHLEGCRTSFTLRASDAKVDWLRNGTLRVGFADGQSVSIWVFEGASDFGARPVSFHHDAKLWRCDREYPEGESVLPPLSAYPTI